MYLKSNSFRTFFRLCVLCVCEFSLFLQFMNLGTSTGVKRMLCYFTPLVYFLGFFYFFYLVCTQKGKEHPLLKGAVMVSIFAAGIAVPFLSGSGAIASTGDLQYGMYSSGALHFLAYYLFPILVLLDYLLFVPQGQYKALYPPAGLIFPALYGIFLLLRAKFGSLIFHFGKTKSAYPYLFLDEAVNGTNKVILTVVCIAIGFLSIGYLLFLLDWALGKIRGKKK